MGNKCYTHKYIVTYFSNQWVCLKAGRFKVIYLLLCYYLNALYIFLPILFYFYYCCSSIVVCIKALYFLSQCKCNKRVNLHMKLICKQQVQLPWFSIIICYLIQILLFSIFTEIHSNKNLIEHSEHIMHRYGYTWEMMPLLYTILSLVNGNIDEAFRRIDEGSSFYNCPSW